jgi:hypothetical protein
VPHCTGDWQAAASTNVEAPGNPVAKPPTQIFLFADPRDKIKRLLYGQTDEKQSLRVCLLNGCGQTSTLTFVEVLVNKTLAAHVFFQSPAVFRALALSCPEADDSIGSFRGKCYRFEILEADSRSR